ncbi:hypothetical protein [Micromonospora sp. NPDC085948]|uniref:hypothetical protein n=1 Tax=Micromonospora sp. NPDC085948 TaxID=3155293 RepID=UPI003427CE39
MSPAGRSTASQPTALPSPEDAGIPELKLWSLKRSISLAISIAAIAVLVLFVGALWYAGFPAIRRDGTVSARTLFDLLKLVFAVVAGIGGVAALVVAYRRQRVAEHANELAEFGHKLNHAADVRAELASSLARAAEERAKSEHTRSETRLFNERFTNASEQLGSEKAAIRLAGAYAMAGLADDWNDGRQTCIDVLCAYLRMPYQPVREVRPHAAVSVDHEGLKGVHEAKEQREVRHTVIRLIGDRLREVGPEAKSWRGCNFDLSSVVFDGGNFEGAQFIGGRVSFARAVFEGGYTTFRGASFSGAEVLFDGAVVMPGAAVSFAASEFRSGNIGMNVYLKGGFLDFESTIFSGAEVEFGVEVLEPGSSLSFECAHFKAGKVHFYETDEIVGISFPVWQPASFNEGSVRFDSGCFDGADVSFETVKFAGSKVSFDRVEFNDGRVSFENCNFNAGDVDFRSARFSEGCDVSFAGARLTVRPRFPHDLDLSRLRMRELGLFDDE